MPRDSCCLSQFTKINQSLEATVVNDCKLMWSIWASDGPDTSLCQIIPRRRTSQTQTDLLFVSFSLGPEDFYLSPAERYLCYIQPVEVSDLLQNTGVASWVEYQVQARQEEERGSQHIDHTLRIDQYSQCVCEANFLCLFSGLIISRLETLRFCPN